MRIIEFLPPNYSDSLENKKKRKIYVSRDASLPALGRSLDFVCACVVHSEYILLTTLRFMLCNKGLIFKEGIFPGI